MSVYSLLPRILRQRVWAARIGEAQWKGALIAPYIDYTRDYRTPAQSMLPNSVLVKAQQALQRAGVVGWTMTKHAAKRQEVIDAVSASSGQPEGIPSKILLRDLARGVVVWPDDSLCWLLKPAVAWAVANPHLDLWFPDDVEAAARAQPLVNPPAVFPRDKVTLSAWIRWRVQHGAAWEDGATAASLPPVTVKQKDMDDDEEEEEEEEEKEEEE